MRLRPDLELIAEWIQPKSRVLDLGCGDGALLAHLQGKRGVTGYGLEIDPDNILMCIKRGVPVVQHDLDAGLKAFQDNAFDYVIMTQTLQAVRFPQLLLTEMLRIGREGIVTFPNLGHWRCRLQIALGGKMPLTRALPIRWYETPHIHLCTLRDFENLCLDQNIELLQCSTVDHSHRSSLGTKIAPNLFGELAIYRIRRQLR